MMSRTQTLCEVKWPNVVQYIPQLIGGQPRYIRYHKIL